MTCVLSECLPSTLRPTILHATPQEDSAAGLLAACASSPRFRRRPEPFQDSSPWQPTSRSAWRSSAWASGPSLFRSIRIIPGPSCTAICRRDQEGPGRVRRPLEDRQTATPITASCSNDPNIDAVHINSPIPDHARKSSRRSKAGKHVACTVPMATTIEECRQIVKAQRKSGKIYMMMETVVYSREYLFVKELYDQGELGRHPVPAGLASARHGRLARLLGGPAADALRHPLRQPLPGDPGQACRERRLPRLGPDREDLIPRTAARSPSSRRRSRSRTPTSCAEVTRSLFDTARQYRESFDAYGSKKSFEWQQVENEEPVIHTKSTPEPPLPSPRSPSG